MQAYTESFINRTENHMIGEETWPVEGTVFEDMSPGEIYRWLVKEYGRCTGKVYVHSPSGTKHTGWVFQRNDRYEDTGEVYLREVWVTFQDRDETVRTVEHHDFSSHHDQVKV